MESAYQWPFMWLSLCVIVAFVRAFTKLREEDTDTHLVWLGVLVASVSALMTVISSYPTFWRYVTFCVCGLVIGWAGMMWWSEHPEFHSRRNWRIYKARQEWSKWFSKPDTPVVELKRPQLQFCGDCWNPTGCAVSRMCQVQSQRTGTSVRLEER